MKRFGAVVAGFLTSIAIGYGFVAGAAAGLFLFVLYAIILGVAWLFGIRERRRSSSSRVIVAELVGGPCDGYRLVRPWPPDADLVISLWHPHGKESLVRYKLATGSDLYDVIRGAPANVDAARPAVYAHEEEL
jgi:hypothetical protein